MTKIKLPKTITSDWLRCRFACSAGREYFERVWGAEVRPDRSALERVAGDNPAHLYWLLNTLGRALWVPPSAYTEAMPALAAIEARAHMLNSALREALLRGVDEGSEAWWVLNRGDICYLCYAIGFLPSRDALRRVAHECFDIPE